VPTSRNVGYSITFSNRWTAQNHPFRYPSSDPHYSQFFWASHSSDYVMWENGGTATRGIENVAEIGSIGTLRNEVQEQQNMGNVLDDVVGSTIGTAFGGARSISNEDLCVDASHPYVSGLGMIAPSPDWFSGAYNVPLWDEETMTWYRRVTVNVYAWDAGTEDGDDYRFNNPATSGGVISAFMAGDTKNAVFVSEDGSGGLRVLRVGVLTFELQESSAKCASALIVGETGRTLLSNTIDVQNAQNVATINFRNEYINPVVVAFINTRNGGQSVSARIRALTSSSCELFMQEPDNQGHVAEWVSYIVVESGRYILEGDIVVEAGIASTTIIHRGGQPFSGHPVQFQGGFSSTPAVLHSLVTHNNNDFMASMITNVGTSGFSVAMEAAGSGKNSASEDAGWIAFSPKTGSTSSTSFVIGIGNDGTNDGVTNSPHVIDLTGNFNGAPDVVVSVYNPRGWDGSWARGAGIWTMNKQTVYAEEDQVSDNERGHLDELFAWAAFLAETDLVATA